MSGETSRTALIEMRGDRMLVVVLGGLLATGLGFILYQHGPRLSWFPECVFHRLTGLHCPSCGMTRATAAALHGRFGEAWRFNPLGMIVGPGLVVWVGLGLPAWLRNQPPPAGCRIGRRGWWWFGAVVLGYWVLRNIPVWPLTCLAPP